MVGHRPDRLTEPVDRPLLYEFGAAVPGADAVGQHGSHVKVGHQPSFPDLGFFVHCDRRPTNMSTTITILQTSPPPRPQKFYYRQIESRP